MTLAEVCESYPGRYVSQMLYALNICDCPRLDEVA